MRDRVGTWGPTLQEPIYPITNREKGLIISQMLQRVLKGARGGLSQKSLSNKQHPTDKSKFEVNIYHYM